MGRKTNVSAGIVLALGAAVAWTYGPSDNAQASPAAPAPPRATAGRTAATPAAGARAPADAAPSLVRRTPLARREDRSPAAGCALRDSADETCSFLEPDDDTMQEMARCGIARLEVPPLPGPGANIDAFPASWREAAGVTDAEHERLEQVAAEFFVRSRAQWAELAATAGIDRAWAETTAPVVVSTRIFATFDEDQYAAAVERVARERAGWEPTGEDVPSELDAAVRLRLDAGDAYEAAIAETLGATRAAELRAASDGWPGSHGSLGNRCEVEAEPPRARDFVPRSTEEAQACLEDAKGQHCAFLAPTDLELDRMADCGVVRFDAPGFLGARFSEPTFDFDDGWANELELTPVEAAALAEVGDSFRDDLYRDLTALALEAGKSQEWADQTPFLGMMIAIAEGSGSTRADTEAMFRRLAEERAGRIQAPADLSNRSLDERFMRRVIALGDAFEQALAKRVGAERARALRSGDDGWPGLRLQTQNYCDGTKPQTF